MVIIIWLFKKEIAANMAKGSFRLDKVLEKKDMWDTRMIDSVSALEVEKSFLRIKPQDFIKVAPCRRIAV